MTVMRSRFISRCPAWYEDCGHLITPRPARNEAEQKTPSYFPNGRFTEEDEFDTAARLGWHSGRVCHNRREDMQVQVDESKGVVDHFAQHEGLRETDLSDSRA